MTTPTTQKIPPIIYASLTGPIDQAMVQRVFNSFAVAINGGVKEIHMAMHSAGGTIPDGFALHNYFKAIPIDLRLYNAGTIASIAVIAFLGCKNRYASANATFMVHKSYANASIFTSAAAANASRLRGLTSALEIEDARTRSILKAELAISDDRLDEHLVNELPFDSAEALQCEMISAIKEFVVPPGNMLSNI